MDKRFALRLLAAMLLCISCGKPVLRQQETIQKGHDIVRTEKGDTVGYVVSFHDSADRKRFALSFEKLLNEYPFRRDTLVQNRYFHLDLASAVRPGAETKPAPVETLFMREAPLVPGLPEKTTAKPGGSVTFYSQRAFLDGKLSELVECRPFSESGCAGGEHRTAGYLQVKNVSDREITLVLTDRAENASGKHRTSFDLVNAWTTYVKAHPAEGLALFCNVKGLGGLVRGQEAVIAGFVVTDDRTVVLKFDPPDPKGLARLCTPRIMPASLAMGPYAVKSEAGGAAALVPNPHFPGEKPYLSSCTVRLGGDANPVLSFSLNRYDAVMLHSAKDLDFARHKAPEQSVLAVFSEDRYFISCNLDNPAARQAVRNAINPREILANFVKAEGTVLFTLETDNTVSAPPVAGDKGQVPAAAAQQIPVLYRSDDPVSAIIAEKVVADLTRSGLSAALKASAQKEYEVSLVRRDYGLAVGWVPSSVVSDESEKLRLATMWFSGAVDESGRIADNRELPLFSVKEYLLCRKKIGFAGDVVQGVFVTD
ncbi:MAG TPA: ABC transporter substrate-binding protein [Chitinivibrionales bacterium]|nr:ABC transporter substrate-binding protein [Chitinivibrionales bacterium]